MKKIYRLIFFLIGIAGIVFLALQADITSTDWNDLFEQRMPLILILQLLLWLVIYELHTSVYRLILGPEVKDLSSPHLFKIILSGMALNSVTPAGLVGGEPYRIMELRPYCGTEKATSATLTFTIFYVVGHAFLWITGTVLYFLMGAPGEIGMSILMAAAGIILSIACIAFFRSRGRGFILALYRFASRLPLLKKLLKKDTVELTESLKAIDEGIGTFNREPKKLQQALAMEYIARLLEGLEYYCILLYLGENISLPGGILVMSTASLIGNLLFIVPMQAGTREGGLLLALGWLGIDSSAGIRTSLLYRARDLLFILIGILCILVEKKVQKKEN